MIFWLVVPRTMESSHHHHAFALEHLAHGVELDLDAEVADVLLRLDEGAADVVVADQGEVQRDAGLLGVADGGGHAGVGDRGHQVGVHVALAGELAAQLLAVLVDAVAVDVAVGPGEVDGLEDAPGGRDLREGSERLHAAVAEDQHLPRLHLAHVLGFDEVEHAGFRRHHVGVRLVGSRETAQDQRPEAYGSRRRSWCPRSGTPASRSL